MVHWPVAWKTQKLIVRFLYQPFLLSMWPMFTQSQCARSITNLNPIQTAHLKVQVNTNSARSLLVDTLFLFLSAQFLCHDAFQMNCFKFQIKSLCDVEYRKFNFSAYPPHVKYLKNYAFKPLVVAVSFWFKV